MPRTDLPRYTLAITLSEAQLDRIDEMIERHNATPGRTPIMTREQAIGCGLAAFEALLFDLSSPGKATVFAGIGS